MGANARRWCRHRMLGRCALGPGPLGATTTHIPAAAANASSTSGMLEQYRLSRRKGLGLAPMVSAFHPSLRQAGSREELSLSRL